jgi:hypothetical protein
MRMHSQPTQQILAFDLITPRMERTMYLTSLLASWTRPRSRTRSLTAVLAHFFNDQQWRSFYQLFPGS